MGHNFEFTNPNVPFTLPVHGGLPYGAVIDIKGHLDNTDGGHCELNLWDEPDIALHIKLRFESHRQEVGINTLEKNKWKKECTVKARLHNHDPVHITVRVLEKHYEILLNGAHIYNYKHNLPVKHVGKFDILGGICVSELKLTNFPHVEGYEHEGSHGHSHEHGHSSDPRGY